MERQSLAETMVADMVAGAILLVLLAAYTVGLAVTGAVQTWKAWRGK